MQISLETALLPQGWRKSVLVEIGPDGNFLSVENGRSAHRANHVPGAAIPGIPNLHCHAHQRAFAGLAERSRQPHDSFWSWRKIMYRCLEGIRPDLLRSIAAQLYLEFLKGGYTHVAEFHYLHHDVDGSPYGNPAELGEAILNAADLAGIGITCLPTLYAYSDFGGVPPLAPQRRFVNDTDSLLAIHARLDALTRERPAVGTGVAFHSLRAVEPVMMRETLAELPNVPVHIHIAEQLQEVQSCLTCWNRRPVELLLGEFDVDARWCLVHATHMTDSETRALAKSGAVAGICPSTEANLGDGLFNAEAFFSLNGAFGIGSDSNMTTDANEELRVFEYGQRLMHQRRNVLTNSATGMRSGLLRGAISGGARAAGANIGAIAPGYRADLVVLDDSHPRLYGRTGDDLIDCWVFSGGADAVRDVYVGGKRLVCDGRHKNEEDIYRDYRAAIRELAD